MTTTDYRHARRELTEARRVALENADTIKAAAVREHRDMAPIEEAAFNSQVAAATRADQGLRALPEPEKARAKRPTYYDGGRYSYYADLAARTAVVPVPGIAPYEADARLKANAADTEQRRKIDAEVSELRAAKYGAEFRGLTGEPLSYRDLSQSDGAGGEFNPPLYLVSHFANVARASAPAWHLAPSIPLPEGCFELVIPQITSGTGAVPAPPAQNTVPSYDDTVTASVTSFVAQVGGQREVSYQWLQQGPTSDKLLIEAAAEDIAAELESLFFTGTGEAECFGVQNTSGVGQVFYTGATTTSLWQAVAGAGVEVATSRHRPPTAIFMAPQRAIYLTGYPDGTGDVPTQRPGQGVFLGTADEDGTKPFTTFAGMGVFASGGVPQTEGAGSDQDVIFVGRIQDSLVAVSPVTTMVMDEGGYAAALTATFRSYLYCAAVPAARYPSSWSYVDGSGLTPPE